MNETEALEMLRAFDRLAARVYKVLYYPDPDSMSKLREVYETTQDIRERIFVDVKGRTNGAVLLTAKLEE